MGVGGHKRLYRGCPYAHTHNTGLRISICIKRTVCESILRGFPKEALLRSFRSVIHDCWTTEQALIKWDEEWINSVFEGCETVTRQNNYGKRPAHRNTEFQLSTSSKTLFTFKVRRVGGRHETEGTQEQFSIH